MSAIRHALTIKREDDFAAWYQEVVSAADMAEESGVRGCMVIKPWGYGIWERMQRLLDARIKAAASAFMPGGKEAGPTATPPPPASDDFEALRQQMAEMQRKLDELSR